jgi:Family of unknown function (DUF6624)
MNAALRDRLVGMAAEDERVRAELAASGELFVGYAPRMAEVHRRNAEALAVIVDHHGWPGHSLVGPDAAAAAWQILQHSIGNPPLLRRCLPLLRLSAAAGDIEPARVAYLEDRISVLEGRPQRYGTQHDWDDDGQLSPSTLEDPARVDAYRAAVGLGTLSGATAALRERARREGDSAPPDIEQRRAEQRAWARAVGWR